MHIRVPKRNVWVVINGSKNSWFPRLSHRDDVGINGDYGGWVTVGVGGEESGENGANQKSHSSELVKV